MRLQVGFSASACHQRSAGEKGTRRHLQSRLEPRRSPHKFQTASPVRSNRASGRPTAQSSVKADIRISCALVRSALPRRAMRACARARATVHYSALAPSRTHSAGDHRRMEHTVKSKADREGPGAAERPSGATDPTWCTMDASGRKVCLCLRRKHPARPRYGRHSDAVSGGRKWLRGAPRQRNRDHRRPRPRRAPEGVRCCGQT